MHAAARRVSCGERKKTRSTAILPSHGDHSAQNCPHSKPISLIHACVLLGVGARAMHCVLRAARQVFDPAMDAECPARAGLGELRPGAKKTGVRAQRGAMHCAFAPKRPSELRPQHCQTHSSKGRSRASQDRKRAIDHEHTNVRHPIGPQHAQQQQAAASSSPLRARRHLLMGWPLSSAGRRCNSGELSRRIGMTAHPCI